MNKLVKLFCCALIVMAGCHPGEPIGPLSEPIVDTPLYSCATTVSVKGFIPGARIDVYANDSILIGGGTSDSPWGQVYKVTPALIAGQKISATQSYAGFASKHSKNLIVQETRKKFGGELPKPVLDKPIYSCGGAISVRNLAKGALLKVYSDGVEIGSVDGCGEGQWLDVTPIFAPGRSITADNKLCMFHSPLSDPVIVSPEPTSLPKLVIGDIYENGKYCIISNNMNGAKVKTYNGGSLIDENYYPGGGQVVRLSPQVMPGDSITATQEFCHGPSEPSNPSVVKPCNELPAPTLAPICPGDISVKITSGVLGARIRVYRDGVLAADGGGDEIMLLAPAVNGENYWATQSLGICVSPKSIALSVGCEKPVVNKVDIPYAGRAVAASVDPKDDHRIIVASETGGLFRSTDKGNNWMQVSGSTTFLYSDVTYLDFEKDVIIATAREDTRKISGGGIWRSADNGNTWKKIALVTPDHNCIKNITGYCLSVDRSSKRVWAATSCGLAYSDNAGIDWRFQAVVPGYNNDAVYAVQTPDANRIVIVTIAGVQVSKDGGLNFSAAMNGIPAVWWSADHCQLAVAPNDPDHIYWAIYHIPDGDSILNRGVFRTTDFGANWKPAFQEQSIIGGKPRGNRPLFVRTASALNGKADNYDVYWGSGFKTFKRATAKTGNPSSIGSFSDMAFDHSDPADVCFENDNATPLLLLTDGGLHKTGDKGKNWKLAGGGPYGYNALQITEVTGQLHQERNGADLYFATQDNSLWASPDLGVTWVADRCCEGFFLNIMRDYYPPDVTRLTGVACGACGNFISKPLLASQGDFKNPPRDKGHPRLLKPEFYIQNTFPWDSVGSLFMLTKNTGTGWDSSYVFPEEDIELSRISGDLNDPVIFTSFKAAGLTPAGDETDQIKKITGLLSAGGPIVSDISAFGSLGIFQTMFASYSSFSVDPKDPDFIIAADIIDKFIKKSTDGGTTWENDTTLTELITGNGEFDFSWGRGTQLSSIGFDPDCSDHIMVGTQQAGVFTTFNRGETWGRIPGTEVIPYVSSFFFAGRNKVVISSYGRGLWNMNYTCAQAKTKSAKKSLHRVEPFIYHGNTKIALRSVRDPARTPNWSYLLIKGGDIIGYTINPRSNALDEVVISSGALVGYSWDGKEVKVTCKVRSGTGRGAFGKDERLNAMAVEDTRVKGIILEKDIFKAPILSEKDILPEELPRQPKPAPYITILNLHGGLHTVDFGEPIRISGRNFKPELELEVLLDGKPVKSEKKPRPDGKGSFVLRIPQLLDLGSHTIIVRQKSGQEVLQDAAAFVRRVVDDK